MKSAVSTFLISLLVLASHFVKAQAPQKPTSADIHLAIKKLNVLGAALYVAAHPDDENTRLIAYLANELQVNTAYLSMTRGDGGQNLIGPEIRELLGVIRTQELLAARRVDGGQQFFTRANDFGYSKHPDETFNIWDKEQVLADAVWTIRKFRPDVMVARFSLEPGRTHGHHTGSAMIAYEAFDLAGDPTKFPEQLKYVEPWQPKRLLFNTSWWFYGSREKFEKAKKENMISVDAGVYYPIKGKSNTEIAAESRSMHKCQGFGSAGSRGIELEYMEHLKGEKANTTLFSGIDVSWNRVQGGKAIGKLLAQVDANFKYENPAASIPDLLKARKLIQAIKDEHWKTIKLQEIDEVIRYCAGLFFEAITDDFTATKGSAVSVTVEAINRSTAQVILQKMSFIPTDSVFTLNQPLENNKGYLYKETFLIPKNTPYTSPYWLNEEATLGMYSVEDQQLIGLPETPRDLKVRFDFTINGEPFIYEQPLVFKRTDPVKGEIYRPFEITPPVFANITNPVYVFADNEPKTVNVLLKAGQENIGGMVELKHPEGWRVEPAQIAFELGLKGEEKMISFKVFPSENQTVDQLKAVVKFESGETFDKALALIEYDHIPTQTVLLPATAKVVRVDLLKKGERVGYIVGAGDEIPASLEQIGYKVTILEDDDMTPANLKQFDAIILGVRAYNTIDRLKFHQNKLLDYVQQGGTLIVQYNTSFRLVLDDIAPYPLELSRDRVAVEEAEVRILQPNHPVMTTPNQITSKDFEGWVQERGLYFPDKWDEKYNAILSSNDPGETPKDGGLLVAQYGKGHYIYTGYSWFRELPAGVPGAFRIFTNLISIGKE